MTQSVSRRSIGVLSRETGVHVETIRYYERIGLMPAPPRSPGGHRCYADRDVRRLGFIRRSRKLGFAVPAIRAMLGMLDGGEYTCGDIRDITVSHLAHVRERIADLQELERTLHDMACACEGGSVPECPIIGVLSR